MVTGIERWKEYFNDYKDKYVLIGGAACNLLEEELDMNPRATKDLDLVLVVEALTPDFGARLWDFSSLPITLVKAKERTSSSMNTIALQIQRTRHIQSR